MEDHDDHVIPYEEVARRRRAREEARSRSGDVHEVKMSDAMDHLLGDEDPAGQDGPTPDALRRIVERDFADDDGRSRPERLRPHLVQPPADEPGGVLCSFETRRCEETGESPEGPDRE